MSKVMINKNTKGQYHGYQESYYGDGKLSFKCFFHNNIEIDYEEFYYFSGKLKKRFYI